MSNETHGSSAVPDNGIWERLERILSDLRMHLCNRHKVITISHDAETGMVTVHDDKAH